MNVLMSANRNGGIYSYGFYGAIALRLIWSICVRPHSLCGWRSSGATPTTWSRHTALARWGCNQSRSSGRGSGHTRSGRSRSRSVRPASCRSACIRTRCGRERTKSWSRSLMNACLTTCLWRKQTKYVGLSWKTMEVIKKRYSMRDTQSCITNLSFSSTSNTHLSLSTLHWLVFFFTPRQIPYKLLKQV